VLLAIQRGDGGLGFVIGTHFHKPKALAASGVPIRNHFGAGHASMLGKQFLKH